MNNSPNQSLEVRRAEFLERMRDEFSEWDVLNPLEYKSSRKSMTFKHIPCGSVKTQIVGNFFCGGGGCSPCHYAEMLFDKEDFVRKANEQHGDAFDYTKVEYKGSNVKVCIVCKCHSVEFWQEPRNHWIGHGCPECTIEKLSKANLKSKEEFIALSKSIHGNKYLYDRVVYEDNDTDVEIFCVACSKYFWCLPRIHISGHDCFDCGVKARTEQLLTSPTEFEERARVVHGDKYKYDLSNFNGNTKNNILIWCPDCEQWYDQRPTSHLQGAGCPHCVGGSISMAECRWLDVMGVAPRYRQKTIRGNDSKYRVDAYDHTQNIVYEFYGDFWHGNPSMFDPSDINPVSHKSFGDLYEATLRRKDELIKLGYKVVFIWESDFYEQYGKRAKVKNDG